MSRLVGPRGVVCAFEASPRIVDKTQYNVTANGCGNVQIFHNAVSDTSNERLEIFAGSHLNDSILPSNGTSTGRFVETIALDDFVAHWGLIPSLVKMDIEGAEYAALKGFARTIAAHKPYLILEQQPNDMRCHAMLSELGYQAIDLATYKEIRSPDGFSKGAGVANILFHHGEAVAQAYRAPIERTLIANLKPGELENITLSSGRYVFEVDMSADGTDNDMMCGIADGDKVIFRYNTYTQFLASSYREWPVHLARETTLRLFFDFINGTKDHTFKVAGAKLWRLNGFD